MPEGGILLDLTSCRDWGMVQDAIRRAFGFPAHYGENWDAMWDCLTDLFWVTDDRRIVVRGLDALPPDLRAYAEPLRQVLEDLRTRCPRLRVTYCLPIFNDMWYTLWRQGPDLSKRRKAFVRPGGAVL